MNKIFIEKNMIKAKVDNRIFSSFLEHMGRAIYTGIYEPNHYRANEQGFRMDVIELINELGVDTIRYPGGNFLSGYRWYDGIGPKENRPVRLDLAWRTIESNQFGIDEFFDWSKLAQTNIMAAVNMGTGTPQDAADLLEYTNFSKGTYLSDLRIKNGHQEPYDIKLWCLGNEMDGPWQTCHLDADDYGKKALETAKMMKWVDPRIELVVSGSSNAAMPTYPEWDRIVLEYTYEHVDYLSLHQYYQNHDNNKDFLASYAAMDQFIQSVKATCDYVKALKRSNKTMYLSFDEWNVWYQTRWNEQAKTMDWQQAPAILEDHYSLLDALVFGGLVTTLLNNADRVKIACLAQLVNVIGPIFTQENGPAIKQSIFYPFKDFIQFGKGIVLNTVMIAPKTPCIYGEVSSLANTVIYNEEDNIITIMILNIEEYDINNLEIELSSFNNTSCIYQSKLLGDNLNKTNSFEEPNAVTPIIYNDIKKEKEKYYLNIKALSWNIIRFKVED